MPPGIISRRNLLLGAVAAAGGGATGAALMATAAKEPATDTRVLATSGAVERVEATRLARGTGRTTRATLTAAPAQVDLGGTVVDTWAYGGQLPGTVIRCTAGDLLQVDVRNRLPEPTTVHWHGLRLRNDMDGVPHLTQAPIDAGEDMRYSFVAPDPGTYWLHPHMGLQRARGLLSPLIIDDPHESGDYDVEFVVVLDDWIDGTGTTTTTTPETVLRALLEGGLKSRYQTPLRAGGIEDRSQSWQYHAPGLSDPPPGIAPIAPASRMADAVSYPFYLLNGRLPTAPQTLAAKPGQRARIRLVNAAATTVFRVALGGHQLTVTHTDGFPVEPVTVDTLQVGSGERYDVTVTLADGVFPLVAVAEGHGAQALGVVRTASGPPPSPAAAPTELGGRLLDLPDLRSPAGRGLQERAPDVHHSLYLTGDMADYAWRINAETYNPRRPFAGITPLPIREGQLVRMTLLNQTPMYHPMHLHGHTFTVRAVGRVNPGTKNALVANGTLKDTVMVPPGEQVVVDFAADNPGQWLVHCHNAYHLATGMATVASYVSAA